MKAGLRIARRNELRGLTMQRIGDELGVTGMALYSHFSNKQELIDGILDQFTRETAVTSHGTGKRHWRLWLCRTADAMYRALAETPSVLPFVATHTGWRFGPAASAVLDESLHVLRDAGFSRRESFEVYMTALALTIGWATLDSTDDNAPDYASASLFNSRLRQYLDSIEPKS
ncbi:MAG: TetR/AcrR family transcriptional regulator [bacterium]|nr:TetR/AcrR family transcriptional regulator [bacterium]